MNVFGKNFKIVFFLFLFLPSFSLAAVPQKPTYYPKLKNQLLNMGQKQKIVFIGEAKKAKPKSKIQTTTKTQSQEIASINAPLLCQEEFGPCYLLARVMLYNTFSPGFTTPEKMKKENGGIYMKWSAVGSPGLKWVYSEYKDKWNDEVKTRIDEFLRAGKPVILHGKTKKGYSHAVLIVGKKNKDYLVNDSGKCAKNIPLSDIYAEKNIWGVFMYDKV